MLAQVLGVAVLDTEGTRLVAKYAGQANELYSTLGTFEEQRKLEMLLAPKIARLTSRNEVEVLSIDKFIVLFKSINDVNIFIIGDPEENELILLEVINALYNSLYYCTNGHVGKRQLQENLGTVFLILDELLDQGIIFETDSTVIASRVQMSDKAATENLEQTAFNQALHSAKENLLRSFLAAS